MAHVDVISYLVLFLHVSGDLLGDEYGHEIEMTAVDVIVSAVLRPALEGRDPACLNGLRPFLILNT